jgi:TetR/AcrR family transcriptional regulator
MSVSAPHRLNRAQRRKARTEQAIAEASEDLFLARGFHGVTIEQVAEAADVAVGSIYTHFGNKEGLYLALLERAFKVEESYMAAALQPDLAPLQRLFLAGDAYLRFYLEYPDYFRILVFPHLDSRRTEELPDAAQALATRAEQQIAGLAEIISSCASEGLVRTRDAYRTAKFIWGAWNGVIALNMRSDRLRLGDEELRAVIAEGRRIIAEGIASETVRRPDGSLLADLPGANEEHS